MSLISPAARDLIINQEVASEATYRRLYSRPTWPGGESGITIGIGYDIGAGCKSRDQLWVDWLGHIPDEMIKELERCIGVTGAKAKALLPYVKMKVDVPWEAAIA